MLVLPSPDGRTTGENVDDGNTEDLTARRAPSADSGDDDVQASPWPELADLSPAALVLRLWMDARLLARAATLAGRVVGG
jgi:hypothetical protein